MTSSEWHFRMDSLPDVLGFRTQWSRENEPMAVVMGKGGPQGGGGGGGGGEALWGGGRASVPVSNLPSVSFYPPPSLDRRVWQTLRKVAGLGGYGRWGGW